MDDNIQKHKIKVTAILSKPEQEVAEVFALTIHDIQEVDPDFVLTDTEITSIYDNLAKIKNLDPERADYVRLVCVLRLEMVHKLLITDVDQLRLVGLFVTGSRQAYYNKIISELLIRYDAELEADGSPPDVIRREAARCVRVTGYTPLIMPSRREEEV